MQYTSISSGIDDEVSSFMSSRIKYIINFISLLWASAIVLGNFNIFVHQSRGYNLLYIVHKIFMHLSFVAGCIKINYHWELKVFAPLFWGGLHKNQLCIVNRRFIHPSSKKRYIKINYHWELKIFDLFFEASYININFALLCWGGLDKNQSCIVYKNELSSGIQNFCWGGLYKFEIGIVHRKLMYPSLEERYIKNNYHYELKIFAFYPSSEKH